MTGPEQDPRAEFQELCNALRNDDARNQMICTHVVRDVLQLSSGTVDIAKMDLC
jgi:hypothetical protein